MTTVQSLLFDRTAGWTPTTAREWAKRHGYVSSNRAMEVTDNYVRIRQRDPSEFPQIRTIEFSQTKGIKALVGVDA